MNKTKKKEIQSKKVPIKNEASFKPSVNYTIQSSYDTIYGSFSKYELNEIFIAKCEDFKLKYNEKLFQKFLDRQKELSSSKVLHMESSGLGPSSSNILVNCIFNRPSLRVVYFSDNFLGDNGAFCFADLIYTTKSLIALDLGSNRMTDNGTRSIFVSLKTNSSVSYLNIGSKTSIGRNIIGPQTAIEISEMLKENKIISELNFSMTELNFMTVNGFCPGLSKNRTLTHLNLSNNNIKSNGAISVLKSLYNSNIIELKMSSNHITDDVAPFLTAYLSKNDKIRIIDFSANDLTNRSMVTFSNPSSINYTLEELNLSRNPIGGRGINSIGTFLVQNQKIRILEVNGCLIDANGFIEFCDDLRRNESLEVLHIQHNPLTDEGIVKLSNAIKENKFLKEIDLELVDMMDEGAYKLFPALLESNIETLSVRNNLIHDGSFIQKSLQNNKKLMKLDIEYNDISYTLNKEISKIIAENQKRWKDDETERIKYELNHITSSDIHLQDIRTEIKSEREIIAQLKQEKEELENYFSSSMKNKDIRLNELDEKNNVLGKQVAVLMDDCRNQKSEIITKKSQVESEISQLSSKLAREIEVLKTEFKSVQISEGRLNAFNSKKLNEEEKLNKAYKDAKLRYLDMKENFITAWQMAHEEKENLKNQEELKEEEINKETKQTKSKVKTTKNSKETKSKSKGGKNSKKKIEKKNSQASRTEEPDPNAPVDPKKQVDDDSNQQDDLLITIPGNKVKI